MVKFTIITPCFNAEELIEETIQSVLNQSALRKGLCTLEYIIVDGKSSDKTLERIRDITGLHPAVTVISEKDAGMYDALAKGIMRGTGDIYGYLNAGDYYSPHAFEILLELFEKEKVAWITGLHVSYNSKSYLVWCDLPFRYRKRFFSCGYYNAKKLPFVMQEATFWRKKLNSLIDLQRLSRFKLAGDYYLWHQFSGSEDLKIVSAYLGGFKVHQGQLSQNIMNYYKEMDSIVSKPSLFDLALYYFDIIIWKMPFRVKKFFNQEGLFYYDHKDERFK